MPVLIGILHLPYQMRRAPYAWQYGKRDVKSSFDNETMCHPPICRKEDDS